MRFLANENFPLVSVRNLREASHDVAFVLKDSPGAKDTDILARAAREGRITLTFDRDYGELIYRRGLSMLAGVIYLRFDPLTPEEPGERVLQLLTLEGLYLEGKFTVLEPGWVRQRPLP